MYRKELVENIKSRSKMIGEAPTKACDNAGVGTSFIANINAGQNPGIDKMLKLSSYLKCSVSDLLGDGPTEKIQLPAKDQELLDAYHDADYDTRTIVDLALKPYKKAAAETAV